METTDNQSGSFQTTSTQISVPAVRVAFDELDRLNILRDIDAVLKSGVLAFSERVQALESFWAQYTSCKHAIACSSGGGALEVLIRSLNPKGKDVLVPTNTFIATVIPVILAGGNPVFLDTDAKSMGVNLKEIQLKRTPNTVGVIVTHIGGIICEEIEEISMWCKNEGLWLVEDAAHAHGSKFKGKNPGQFGIGAIYSFFATKVVTCGEGGMIVTNDDEIASECRLRIDYGKPNRWESRNILLSSNFRMSEVDAVIGLSQCLRLNDFIKGREYVSQRYTENLKDVVLILPSQRSSCYKYIILLPKGSNREEFRAFMKQRNIELPGGVYDIPLHLQPVFQQLHLAGSLPIAEDVCSRHVCLPIWYGMSEIQINHVISSVWTWFKKISDR